jgi:phage terminase large subunit
MVEERRITLPYAPRGVFLPFHERKQRWAVLVAHRRAGKTVSTINDKIRRALITPKANYRAAYVAPFFVQAKDIAWDYLKRYAAPVIVDKNESDLWVELVNGARIRLYGADNADRLRGGYLDDVTIDEPADMRLATVWGEIIRPMLADRQGTGTFIGTPKGKNEFHRIFERAKADPDNWFSAVLKASETGLLRESELADARAEMTPEQYAQEFDCSFDAAIVGAYYAGQIAQAEREGRISSVEVDDALPVHTAWDLGIGDSTAIWLWQAAPGGLRIVDYIEDHGKALPHYVAELNAKGYKYGIDFVPHDARARELGTGRTRVETLAGLGRNPRLGPIHTVDDGINAVRQTLPVMWFDRDKTAAGVEALRQYRTEYDEKTKAFKDKPRHDWTSHAADAARYMALAYREFVAPKIRPDRKLETGQVWLPGPPEPRRGVRIRI